MREINKDEFDSIVKDIDEHKEFQKTKSIIHHCSNRYEHSRRVAYKSYVISKRLGLDYIETARAGMLHDFFLVDNKDIHFRDKITTLVNHPKYALKYSEKFFDLSEKEKNIIVSHMFPILPTRVPKYLESWIVNLVDDYVAIKEEWDAKKKDAVGFANLILAFMLLE